MKSNDVGGNARGSAASPGKGETERRLATGRKPAAKNSGFNANYVLGAVIALLALLLAAALIATILEKPQATEAWSLVREFFSTTITALLTLVCARRSLPKRP